MDRRKQEANTRDAASAVDSPIRRAVDVSIAQTGDEPAVLIEILHRVQEQLGHVPGAAIREIALRLNLTRAEVHGVVSFYADFRDAPGGRHQLQLCRAEACQSVGARNLQRHAEAVLGVKVGATADDGAITLAAAYCLGNCALGPAIRLDGQLHGCVTPERLDQLLSGLVP